MKYPFKTAGCVIALMVSFSAAFAVDIISSDYPESAEIRAEIFESWLGKEIGEVTRHKPEVFTDSLDYQFTVSQKKHGTSDQVTIAVVPKGTASVAGTWILTRRLSDGQPLSIRVYPENDPAIWITLRPDGSDPEKGRSRLDLTICGIAACRDSTVGIPFIRLYDAPLATIISLTKNNTPWDLLVHDPDAYVDIEAALPVIRDGLKTLVYFDDGCFDENGDPVMIETGLPQSPSAVYDAIGPGQDSSTVIGGVNCSGFAKWIIDGIVRPAVGTGLMVKNLKAETASPETHFTEIVRETKDLFFALDWTRNLASAVVSLDSGHTLKPDVSGIDVTFEPFAGMTGYAPNVGYRVRDLLPLLYYLAVKEPGHFYLGAISRENPETNLRSYHHVAVFFPYFDRSGRFTVTVFESARETPIASFLTTNNDAWVNLVRVRMPEKGYFLP